MTKEFDWQDIPEKEFEMYKRRLEIVLLLIDEKIDRVTKQKEMINFCENNFIAKSTVYSWIKRYREKGTTGIVFYNPRPKSLRIHDKALREKIINLISELPTRSVPQLRRLLSINPEFKHKISVVSDRTIYRFLYENGMSQKQRYSMLTKLSKSSYKKFEAGYSMELVQGDARDGIWLLKPDGSKKKTYLFLWIDDYSRKILFGKYYDNERLPCMEDSFRYMILRYGIPLKVYLDNGKVYISRHFSYVLHELEIKPIHHKPYQSWCKGKIEADNKIVLNQFQREAQLACLKTVEELNTAFWAWMEVDYNKRIHSSTGQVPDIRFINGLSNNHRRIDDIKKFNAMFLWREYRKITKYGKIKLFGNQYPVQNIPYGKVVQVRFDPFNLKKVYIYDAENTFKETTFTAKIVTNKAPNIPVENKSNKKSLESRNYFARLRQEHIKMQKKANFIPFLKLYKEEANDE